MAGSTWLVVTSGEVTDPVGGGFGSDGVKKPVPSCPLPPAPSPGIGPGVAPGVGVGRGADVDGAVAVAVGVAGGGVGAAQEPPTLAESGQVHRSESGRHWVGSVSSWPTPPTETTEPSPAQTESTVWMQVPAWPAAPAVAVEVEVVEVWIACADEVLLDVEVWVEGALELELVVEDCVVDGAEVVAAACVEAGPRTPGSTSTQAPSRLTVQFGVGDGVAASTMSGVAVNANMAESGIASGTTRATTPLHRVAIPNPMSGFYDPRNHRPGDSHRNTLHRDGIVTTQPARFSSIGVAVRASAPHRAPAGAGWRSDARR